MDEERLGGVRVQGVCVCVCDCPGETSASSDSTDQSCCSGKLMDLRAHVELVHAMRMRRSSAGSTPIDFE